MLLGLAWTPGGQDSPDKVASILQTLGNGHEFSKQRALSSLC